MDRIDLELLAMLISMGPRITMMAISSITAASRKKAMFRSHQLVHFSWKCVASQLASLVASCSCATRKLNPLETAMMAITMALMVIALEITFGRLAKVTAAR